MKLFSRNRDKLDPQPMVIASAAMVEPRQIRNAVRTDSWQREAWDYYDTVSHLRYGLTWIANALSQCTLFVGQIDQDTSEQLGESEPTQNTTAQQPLTELVASQASTGHLLYRMGLHLLVVGESFLVGFDHADRSDRRSDQPTRRWLVCSSDEISIGTGSRVQVRLPESDQLYPLDGNDYAMFRLWRPHPRRAFHADASVKALRCDLGELVDLSNTVRATARSRITRGLAVVPESSSFASPAESENVNPLHADPYIDALVRAASAAVANPADPSSLVPVVTRAPDDATGKFQHLDFATEFSDQVPYLREAAQSNVTKGLELPQEVLDGLGDTNHWSAYRIMEAAVALSIKPMLGLICDSLTDLYLRPALRRLGVSKPDSYRIDGDISALTMRANRAPEALALYEQGLLSREVVLREHGYNTDDMPDQDEANQILVRQLVNSNPQLVHSLLPDLVQAQPALPSTEERNPSRSSDTGTTGEPESDSTIPDPRRADIPRRENPSPQRQAR